MIIGRNQVMEKSNLTSRFDNHDYDGDSLISLALHSKEAREDFKYAYVRNLIEFEHMDDLLIDYEHESIYSSYMLSMHAQENYKKNDTKLELFNHTFTINDFIDSPGEAFYWEEFEMNLTNVEAAINQVLLDPLKYYKEITTPIYTLERDGLLNKKGLMKLTKKFWGMLSEINTENQKEVLNFWDLIHEFDKFLLECSGSISFCTPSFDLKDFVVQSEEITEFKNELLTVEPFLAFHQNLILFEKVSKEISKDPDNILNLVFKSGARLKSVQLLKAASNTGIPTDIYGKAFPANIKNSLLDGLSPEEYFITGDSARLALAVRQEAIPKGGELQRKFFFTTGILKLAPEIQDCGSTKYYSIKVKNMSHLGLLNHRYHFVEGEGLKKVDITDRSLVGNMIKLRSPMTCKCEDYRICKTCFGDKIPESINLGSTVGAALSEGIIQSVLRTHHFGGAFIATEDKKIMEIMRRSKFCAPDTIIMFNSDNSTAQLDTDYIKDYLANIYPEDDIELTENPEVDGSLHLTIKVNELPFNDDSVKQLNNIVGLIDKNREAGGIIDPAVLYDELELVIEQNGILSVYLELIISLLYYDEDGVLHRYSDKEDSVQIALKNIIEMLDPKLSIFYNFSNRIISKIYNHKTVGEVPHMYNDLMEIYH